MLILMALRLKCLTMRCNMNWQIALNFLLTAVSGLVLFILKDLKTDVKDLTKEVHEKYVQKDVYTRDIDDIKNMLEKIFDRLEKKVDK